MTARLRRRAADAEPKRFASKLGATAIASTAPVLGSSTIALPPFAPQRCDGLTQDRLRVRLDAAVEREEDVVARSLRPVGDHVDHAAGRIRHRRLAARPAAQRSVEGALEPLEPLVVEARVAEHVRGHPSLRVVAELLGVEAEAGELQPLQLGGLGRVGLALHVDEVTGTVGEQRIELLGVEPEDLRRGERDPPRARDPARVGVHGRRLLADRERLARPVEDRPAAGRDLGRRLVLARRHPLQRRALDALEPDRAAERGGEDEDEETEEKADAAVGEPLGHRPVGTSWT